MPHQPASAALSRFVVLDLTRARAGPTAARQLADWGADVIKVEQRPRDGEGDTTGGDRHDSDFQNLHRNKRSIAVDLKQADGLAVFKRMVERADVVIENYRPEVKRRLRIDYDAMCKINRGLIYASISGFGQSGPYRDRPGFDQIAQGLGGLMSITGLPGQGPVRVGVPISDLAAGLLCANGILTALLEREVSGEGQWLHTSLLEAQIYMLDFQAARYLVGGEVPGQAGNDHPTRIPMGVFGTCDGHINIGASGETIWRRLCEAIGAATLADQPDYADAEARSRNRSALNAEINRHLATADSATWIERLNAAGVPCGPINSMDEVFADPQVHHLGIARDVESPVLGPITLVGQPVTLTRTPGRIAAPSPECGEHGDEILAALGYAADDIDDLRARDVI